MPDIQKNCVEVLATADSAVDELFRALGRKGIGVAAGAPLRIVLSDDPLEPGLADVASQCQALDLPWLLVVPGELGPLFIPNGAPCWQCFRRRMWLNGHAGTSDIDRKQTAVLFDAAAREAAGWFRRHSSRLIGRQQRVDGAGALQLHPVVPACAECLARAPKARLDRPSLISSWTGIAEAIEVREAAPGFFRARSACSQVLIPNSAGQFLQERQLQVEGKGVTADAAMRSCMGEAVERYSLMNQGDERRIRATRVALGDAAVDPRQVLLTSDRQYRRRAWWQKHHGSFHWVTEPFDDNYEMEWVEARNAQSGARCWLPAEHCLLGYGGRFAQADSNGCASGATWWPAARNALLELVERDAVAIWWYNRVRRPKVHWEGLSSKRIDNLAKVLRARKRRFWLLDVTTDIPLPVYVAVSCDPSGRAVMLGSGAGADPETAAWRALAEMASHVIDLEMSTPSAHADGNERELWKWWQTSSIDEHPYVKALPAIVRPHPVTPRPPAVEFRHCLKLVRSAGLEVLLYDHTRPELKIPVVRAVVPGLRHWWARFAPGRLYDVPLRLGWRSKPITEKDVNPVPYFL